MTYPHFDIENSRLIFSTGKSIYAHAGIIGMSTEGETYYGYDGGLDDGQLTAAERRELAMYMVRRWLDYAECAENAR